MSTRGRGSLLRVMAGFRCRGTSIGELDVGTLADLGRGRLPPDAVARMLDTGDRAAGGVTAPPQGLTLLRVLY